MKQYQVKMTDKALADIEAIYQYIAESLQAPDTAMKQYNRIADGIESLAFFRSGTVCLSPSQSMT